MGVGADWREYVCIVLYSQQKGEEANVNISYLYSTSQQQSKPCKVEDDKKLKNKNTTLGQNITGVYILLKFKI